MSALKSGSSLRTLVLTPERMHSFFIPPRSPFLASPRLRRRSTDRTRLLSDNEDDTSGATPASSPETSPRFLLRVPPPRVGRHHRTAATAAAVEYMDVDLTTCAPTSLSHDAKGKMPRGFRAVLSKNMRESLFHHKKPVKVTVTDAETQDPVGASSGRGKSQVMLRPVKALGLQVMKELKRPAAALKSLSPRVTGPR